MSNKKAINLSLDSELLAKARAEGINLSASFERSLKLEVANLETERWKHENASALEAMIDRITNEGVAGDQYRRFG
jgi:antitoxin CcdA